VKRKLVYRSPKSPVTETTDINPVAVKVLFKLCQNEVWNEIDKSDVNWLEITNDIINGFGLGIDDVKGLLLSLSALYQLGN
jgi:hypothetical protein